MINEDMNTKLKNYPDVITVSQFREILNNMADKSVRIILKERNITCFKIDNGTKIPLICVKTYLASKDFQEDKKRFPTLARHTKYFVIAVTDSVRGTLYHQRSHGQSETKKGSFLTAEITKAKQYSQYARAKKRLQQMILYYGNRCYIREINEKERKQNKQKMV